VESEGTSPTREEVATAAITRELIGVTKSVIGRGPTKGKTYLQKECVLVLMRDAHTVAEASMAGGGRQRDVAQARVDLSEDARQAFIEVVERHTERRVVGFISGSQQEPSLVAYVFVLETFPLLSAVPSEPEGIG
jgi:uncharacterized protein YbcI